jgi:hypothetical protein
MHVGKANHGMAPSSTDVAIFIDRPWLNPNKQLRYSQSRCHYRQRTRSLDTANSAGDYLQPTPSSRDGKCVYSISPATTDAPQFHYMRCGHRDNAYPKGLKLSVYVCKYLVATSRRGSCCIYFFTGKHAQHYCKLVHTAAASVGTANLQRLHMPGRADRNYCSIRYECVKSLQGGASNLTLI